MESHHTTHSLPIAMKGVAGYASAIEMTYNATKTVGSAIACVAKECQDPIGILKSILGISNLTASRYAFSTKPDNEQSFEGGSVMLKDQRTLSQCSVEMIGEAVIGTAKLALTSTLTVTYAYGLVSNLAGNKSADILSAQGASQVFATGVNTITKYSAQASFYLAKKTVGLAYHMLQSPGSYVQAAGIIASSYIASKAIVATYQSTTKKEQILNGCVATAALVTTISCAVLPCICTLKVQISCNN